MNRRWKLWKWNPRKEQKKRDFIRRLEGNLSDDERLRRKTEKLLTDAVTAKLNGDEDEYMRLINEYAEEVNRFLK